VFKIGWGGTQDNLTSGYVGARTRCPNGLRIIDIGPIRTKWP
jgi:hypothetical protein